MDVLDVSTTTDCNAWCSMCTGAVAHLVSSPHAARLCEASITIFTVTVSLQTLEGCGNGIGRDLHGTAEQVNSCTLSFAFPSRLLSTVLD
jgi:hypothetical protein